MSQVINSAFRPRTEMDFGRMFDPYLHNKGSDNNNLDLSLSVAPVSHHSYMADPGNYGSFGSGGGGGGSAAEYASEVPPMTSHEAMPQPHTAPQQHPSHAQAMYQMGVVGGLHGPTGPQFPPQNLYIPPISQHGPIMAAQTTGYVGGGHGVAPTNPVYTSAGMGLPTHNPTHLMMANAAAASAMIPSPYNYPRPPAATRTGGSPNSAGSPSPGSEDSDDSTHLQAGGRGKRPSPEACVEPQLAAPAAATPAAATKGKKARVSKKSKKKKDPNEPQKPVSAYALFFRDTQAAIKGQNPNASFGEVSKIVASMWDGLDADTKSVYKKKTDEKKKDYLKELAAYRASLVSKGEGDIFSGATGAPGSYQPPFGASQQYAFPASTSAGAMPPPQGHVSPQQLSPLAKKSPLMPGMPMPNDGGQSALMNPPMSQPMPPSAPSMMSHGAIGPQGPAAQNASRQPPARTPPHLNPMPPSPYNMTQNNAPLGSPVSAISGDPIHKPPQQPNPQQQQQSQHQHQHQQQHHHQQPPQAPPPQHNMQPSPQQHGSTGVAPSGPAAGGLQACGNGGGSCIRAGCTNPAVHNPEWEDEYCSNECVVSHCRDVFNSWVASGQSAAPAYPASVK